MPLGVCYKVTSIWDDIVVKMECCLASWKTLYLSRAAGLPSSSVLSPISLRTSCPSFSFLFVWSIALRSSKETFNLGGGIGDEFKISHG
jgi:hypothetical protein